MLKGIYYLGILFFMTGILHQSVNAQQLPLELELLTKGADIVLTGRVTGSQSEWNADQTRIYTNVSISVEEYLKGGTGSATVVFRHPGGEVGAIGELYTHIPTFKLDEEVLLFAKKDRDSDTYEVYQGESGKISLINDEITGEKRTADYKKISSLKEAIRKSLKDN